MKSLFINKFEKGGAENQNIGVGALVGIDTYSKKGVARLAKKSTLVTNGGWANTAYPTFIDFSQSGNYIWAQFSDGSIYYSSTGGVTWSATDTSAMTSGGQTAHGNGLIFFQNFMIAFNDTRIWYWKDTATQTGSDPSGGAWVDWTTGKTLGALQNFATDPISGLHFPFLYPNSRGVYFGNGGAGQTSNAITTANGTSCSVGFFGQNGTTTFWPGGTLNTDFLWNNGILQLPASTYTIGSLNFLPPSLLTIAVNQYQNPSQGADLITWDTVSQNKFNPPLRIFSNINSTDTATITAGIKQLYNRNQVLYAVTGGNHTIYETNGSSFNLRDDISLRCSIRDTTTNVNGELDSPVFFNSFPSAINVLGNKLLTGTAPMNNNSTASYPPSNSGFFPVGVWSIAFNNDGSTSTQCEFVIPDLSLITTPSGSGNYLKITAVKPISIDTATNSTGQLLIGYAEKTGIATTSGFSIVDLYNYNTNLNFTAIESELFEVGTYLSPKQIGNIEINFVKKLKTSQTFDLAYRVGIEDGWTNIPYEGNATATGDGSKNSYSYTSNAIGAVQFIQLRFRMATDDTNLTSSPELRTIIINPLDNN